MKRSTVVTGLLAAAVGLLFVHLDALPAQQAGTANRAVLVELFTSEGCSSCPPADRLLVELDERQPAGVEVIALGEHVDYWDGLGWRDRFSSAQVTGRQQSYSLHFGKNRVYTPQMIVDGFEEFVGSDKRQAQQAIQRAASRAKARLRIEPSPSAGDPLAARWTIHVDSLPPKAPRIVDVYVAVTESGLSNQVSRGENRGRLLKHTSVVRVLQKIGEFENNSGARFEHGIALPLDPSWERENLRIAAFVQEPAVGRVLGAVSIPAAAQ